MSDERNPKEASKLFYDMIKAGVSPKASLTDDEIIGAVKKRFNAIIEKQDDRFILVDNDLSPKHSLVKEIDKYIQKIRKDGI